MAVEIKRINEDTENPEFQATDLETGDIVPCKNWFEKSKNKWHIVLGANSANRKYVAHNEFNAKNVDGVYIVEDKTTGPRVLGSPRPDAKLVPFMSEADKALYDEIIERGKPGEPTEEEKLEAQIARLQAKLDGTEYVSVKKDFVLPEDQDTYKAILERAAEAKANAPKATRAPRGPLTAEQKIARDEKALLKLQAKLEAMRAASATAND